MINVNIEKARELYDANDFSAASKNYLKALQDTRDNKTKSLIWAELAWTFYNQRMFGKSLEAIETALEYDSGYEAREDLFRLRGFCYIGLQEAGRAIENLEKSLRINRTEEKQQYTIFELAKLYFKTQNYEKAAAGFAEIENYFYQNNREYWLAVLFYKGFIAYYANEIEKSETHFEELLENAPDAQRKATAIYGLAYIAFNRQDYLKTINLCEAVVTHDSQFFDKETLGFLTAASFHYLGRDDIFEQYYRQLNKQYPNGRYAADLNKIKRNIK